MNNDFLKNFNFEGHYPQIKLLEFLDVNLDVDDILKNQGISLTIPQGIKVIGEYCFFLSKLKEIFLPEGLQIIEQKAFMGSLNLEIVHLPMSLIEINSAAFYNTGLKKLDYPPTISLQKIEKETFYGCKFKFFKVPRSVTYIGQYAFANNPNLKYVYIPSSVKEIALYAFKDCKNLVGIYLEGSINAGFKEEHKIEEVKETRVVSGWDYHTHVGDPELETVTYQKNMTFSWKEDYHKIYENILESDFDKLLY